MTALTKNERNMIFELAKGASQVGELAKVLIKTTTDEQTQLLLAQVLQQNNVVLEQFMKLVDEEWLPK